jgi:N-ethylmaleimide reductase
VEHGKIYFAGYPPRDYVEAQAMTLEDIRDTIEDYVHASKTAMAAGFDGVEIHSANGYLLDQFLCDNINQRTDIYGGSVENRSRLVFEVTDAVCATIGAERVGIRFSPWGLFQGTASSDVVGQYAYVAEQADKRQLAYIHFIEPRTDLVKSPEKKIQQLKAIAEERGVPLEDVVSMAPIKKAIKNIPILSNGEYNDMNALEPLDKGDADGIVYGRLFISNPDLPKRLKNGWPLTPYDRKTFYTPGPRGYIDYPVFSSRL